MKTENIAYFERQIDVVHHSSLEPYDDGKRAWVVVTSSTVSLATVAAVLLQGDLFQFQQWLTQERV